MKFTLALSLCLALFTSVAEASKIKCKTHDNDYKPDGGEFNFTVDKVAGELKVRGMSVRGVKILEGKKDLMITDVVETKDGTVFVGKDWTNRTFEISSHIDQDFKKVVPKERVDVATRSFMESLEAIVTRGEIMAQTYAKNDLKSIFGSLTFGSSRPVLIRCSYVTPSLHYSIRSMNVNDSLRYLRKDNSRNNSKVFGRWPSKAREQ